MKKIIRSFGYAFKGVRFAYATQLNFKVHAAATLLAVALGLWLRIGTNQWLWLLLCITLVITAEMLNTAIEILTDIASPQWNEKAGRVKDLSAGAVVIVAAFALISGLIIFLPEIYRLLTHAA